MQKEALAEFISGRLAGTPYFLVDLDVSADNDITVEIDSFGSIDLDYCVELSKAIEEVFPRDEEDYSLEVGSAGITSPFKVHAQYEKNVGQDVEVLTSDGRKLRGLLAEAGPDSFTLRYTVREKMPGSKRPVEKSVEEQIPYSSVRSAQVDFRF